MDDATEPGDVVATAVVIVDQQTLLMRGVWSHGALEEARNWCGKGHFDTFSLYSHDSTACLMIPCL